MKKALTIISILVLLAILPVHEAYADPEETAVDVTVDTTTNPAIVWVEWEDSQRLKLEVFQYNTHVLNGNTLIIIGEGFVSAYDVSASGVIMAIELAFPASDGMDSFFWSQEHMAVIRLSVVPTEQDTDQPDFGLNVAIRFFEINSEGATEFQAAVPCEILTPLCRE
jgi:hypothetical protein